jgi:arabinan endo-1,5-alpha-L-arabinosidase
MKIGNRYLVVYGATGGGGSHKGAILTMWNNTLDPNPQTLNILNRL